MGNKQQCSQTWVLCATDPERGSMDGLPEESLYIKLNGFVHSSSYCTIQHLPTKGRYSFFTVNVMLCHLSVTKSTGLTLMFVEIVYLHALIMCIKSRFQQEFLTYAAFYYGQCLSWLEYAQNTINSVCFSDNFKKG